VEQLFAFSDLPPRADFLDALFVLTEGNPFFVEEAM
jgi:hypothetical protein